MVESRSAIRYVIADLDGRSHAYFDWLGDAKASLTCDYDGADFDDLYVVGYADGSLCWGPRAAQDLLVAPSYTERTLPVFLAEPDGSEQA